MVLEKHGHSSSTPVLDDELKSVEGWNAQNSTRCATSTTGSATSVGSSAPQQADRTGCRPVFEGTDVPIDPFKTYNFMESHIIPQAKLESDYQFLAMFFAKFFT